MCFSTSANPPTANSKTSDGTGTGSFTSALTGLTVSTTYYVGAYAINSKGTAYGNEQSFTTTIQTVAIGTQVWMVNNLNLDVGNGSWCYNERAIQLQPIW